jgi:hypothetical protein
VFQSRIFIVFFALHEGLEYIYSENDSPTIDFVLSFLLQILPTMLKLLNVKLRDIK